MLATASLQFCEREVVLLSHARDMNILKNLKDTKVAIPGLQKLIENGLQVANRTFSFSLCDVYLSRN